MTKRIAFIGTVIAVLTIGLVGLVLWQTGVISRQAWTGRGPDNSGGHAAFERRQLPVAKGEEETLVSADQTASQVQPEEPVAVQGGPGPASDVQGPSQPEEGTKKPIPVPQVGEGERRYPGQDLPGQPEKDVEKTLTPGSSDTQKGNKGAHSGLSGRNAPRPVVIRFGFDPVRNSEMNVALVHCGDRISVKVRRAGQAGCGLYLAFGFLGTIETDTYREWIAGPRWEPAVPIRDGSRIALPGTDDFGADVPSKLDSKEGALLKLGEDCSAYGWPRIYRDDWHRYEIEMKIYPGNRWNIRPKSLL